MPPRGVSVAHAIPGRIRIRLATLRGNPSLGRDIEEAVGRLPGLVDVEANPITGTVLVRHGWDAKGRAEAWHPLAEILALHVPDLDAHRVAAHIATHARSRQGEPGLGSHHVTRVFRDLNDQVTRTTGGLDLKLLVPLALVAFGVRGLLFAEQTAVPRWYDFLWFGFGTFMMLNAAGVPAARAAEEAAELTAQL